MDPPYPFLPCPVEGEHDLAAGTPLLARPVGGRGLRERERLRDRHPQVPAVRPRRERGEVDGVRAHEDRVRSDGRIGEVVAQRQRLRAAEAVDRDAAHDPTLVPPGGPGNRAGPVVAAGTLGGVSRVFFTPKWLLRHVLALVLIAACLRLGWWQLDEARRTGDAQNIGYTLEWPVFALAVVFVWVRLMQWEINPPAKGSRLSRPLHPAPPAPAAPAAQVTVPRDETDERLDRYNAYLARLAAEEERR
jgi:hypothetical protein